MTERVLVVLRNAISGAYFTGDGIEEGGFCEAMILPERSVPHAILEIEAAFEEELGESQKYIGRRRPANIDIEPVSFTLTEPVFVEGELSESDEVQS